MSQGIQEWTKKNCGRQPLKIWSDMVCLKVQSCKLHNNKYIIASTQIINPEIFAFLADQVFKLLSQKVLFYKKKRQ